ncbi:MAG: hypothetical protein HC904_09330 [Blastochloris sp.]|nr:hypothetical protein [Blastochloris sp.]
MRRLITLMLLLALCQGSVLLHAEEPSPKEAGNKELKAKKTGSEIAEEPAPEAKETETVPEIKSTQAAVLAPWDIPTELDPKVKIKNLRLFE